MASCLLSARGSKPWEEREWAEESEGRERMLPSPGLTVWWLFSSLKVTESILCIYSCSYYFAAILESVRGVKIKRLC